MSEQSPQQPQPPAISLTSPTGQDRPVEQTQPVVDTTTTTETDSQSTMTYSAEKTASANDHHTHHDSHDTTVTDGNHAVNANGHVDTDGHANATNGHAIDTVDAATLNAHHDGPPPLPYNLHEHKLMIGLFWFLIFMETTLIPVIFYFTISNLTDMRPGAMFAIITAMFGFISGGEYGLRGLRLALKTDEYRPLNSTSRWSFDTVHLVLGPPYFVMTALMIGFSIPDPPKIRGLSIIMPIGMIMVTLYMIYTGIAHQRGWRLTKHRLSSHVIGDRYPPLTFTIMEDITGCDGGGGKKYRAAALARYNASPRFRRMLVQFNWAWAISGLVTGIVLLVLAWIIEPDVGYALGWAIPSLWGIVGAFLTIKWGSRSLRIEKEMWAEDQRKQLTKA